MFERIPQHRMLRAAGFAFMVLFLTLVGGGNAQAQVPGGSYLRTCNDARMNGDGLEAVCRRMNGSWRRTFLPHAYECAGIDNIDGSLRCAAYREPPRRGLPGGSYQRSCERMRMDGDVLIASCRTRRGSWVESVLPRAYGCRGIDNIDGSLVCR